MREKILDSYFGSMFDETSIAKSKDVGKIYKKLAKNYNCEYFDVNEFVKPSDYDGLHFDEASHKIIADKLTDLLLTFE